MNYKIGSRGSKLALIQTEYVKKQMEERFPEDSFEIVIIRTKGDKVQDKPMDQIGGSGLFVKEIERALMAGEIDLAVHSMKDTPCELPEGLCFVPPWKREDPRDVLILREYKSLEELPQKAVIATGSKRRALQLLKVRKDLQIVDIRGNVDTRIKKMQEQKLDGLVLAAAGLHRLEKQECITQYFDPKEMIPAPTQGTLAIELKKENQTLLHKLSTFSDQKTTLEAEAEREFLKEMGADCHLPVGAFAQVEFKDGKNVNEDLTLMALYGRKGDCEIQKVCVSGKTPKEAAKRAAREIRRKIAGLVTILGAGPGDEDLLTEWGKNELNNAQCVIFDRLASEKLLDFVPENCEKIYVGKENHHHTLPQKEINELLVRKSLEYKNVIRLKGGDPFVFGRGGEEVLYLKEKGVPYQVVPGISSALAGLSAAGIPITHRGISTGFRVVTAHDQRDKLAEIDFDSMAQGKETCVFLMGLSKLNEIVSGLQKAGMGKSMPVAVVSNATMPDQRCCVGTLEDIESKVHREGLSSPAIIAVGPVVSLRQEIGSYYERRNSCRCLVAVTRSKYLSDNGQQSLSRKLKKYMLVDEVCTGVIKRIPQSFEKNSFHKWDWILFTSKNGVGSFFENLKESGLDLRALQDTKIAAIGKKTAKMLMQYACLPDLVCEEANSLSFSEKLKQNINSESMVLYICNQAEKHSLQEELQKYCRLEILPTYVNEPQKIVLPEGGKAAYDLMCFSNAQSVYRLFEAYDQGGWGILTEKTKFCAIGSKCAEAIQKYGVSSVYTAEQANFEKLAELCIAVCKENNG